MRPGGRSGRPRRRTGRCAALVLAGAAGLATWPACVGAQESPTPAGRTRFASFDIGFGGVKPIDAEWGLSYGVAFDVANLFVRGASLRFGFRFWTADSQDDAGRAVDLDDSVFDIVLKKNFGSGPLGAYIGAGIGLHVIDARYGDFFQDKESRDGVRPAITGILGAQRSVVDEGFISLFLEGQGSLLTDVSHGVLHLGVRIRFDRLGTGG